MKNSFNSRIIIFAAVVLCAVGAVFCVKGEGAISETNEPTAKELSSRRDFNLPGRSDDMPETGDLFVRMLVAVGVVCLLGFGVIYVSKRWLPRMANVPAREIQVVASANLGNRKMVHLLEVGGKKILVGSTNDSMTKLAEFESFDEHLDKESDLI